MSTVTVTKDRYTVESLYQWDKNQKLKITGLSLASLPEIHFTNCAMDRAIVRQATIDGAGVITADIPNSLLQKPYKITAHVCIYDGETFESLYSIDIPVNARKKPGDYTLENDTEVYSFNALENEITNRLLEIELLKQSFRADYENTIDSINNIVQTLTQSNEDLKSELITEVEDLTTDYIVELGTVNNWTYRKWKSGIVECWVKFTESLTISVSITDSTFYRCNIPVTRTLPPNLFESVESANVTVVRSDSITDAVYLSRVSAVSKESISCFVYRDGVTSPSANFDFYITIKGTWK